MGGFRPLLNQSSHCWIFHFLLRLLILEQKACIFRLIGSCCNGDKLVRATELVKLLTLEKSVRGAIKLVTAMKLPNLAERFIAVLNSGILFSQHTAAPIFPIGVSNTVEIAENMEHIYGIEKGTGEQSPDEDSTDNDAKETVKGICKRNISHNCCKRWEEDTKYGETKVLIAWWFETKARCW